MFSSRGYEYQTFSGNILEECNLVLRITYTKYTTLEKKSNNTLINYYADLVRQINCIHFGESWNQNLFVFVSTISRLRIPLHI